jgi:hypothetical protein
MEMQAMRPTLINLLKGRPFILRRLIGVRLSDLRIDRIQKAKEDCSRGTWKDREKRGDQ